MSLRFIFILWWWRWYLVLLIIHVSVMCAAVPISHMKREEKTKLISNPYFQVRQWMQMQRYLLVMMSRDCIVSEILCRAASLFFLFHIYSFMHALHRSYNVGPPIQSRLKYLNCYWMDVHGVQRINAINWRAPWILLYCHQDVLWQM